VAGQTLERGAAQAPLLSCQAADARVVVLRQGVEDLLREVLVEGDRCVPVRVLPEDRSPQLDVRGGGDGGSADGMIVRVHRGNVCGGRLELHCAPRRLLFGIDSPVSPFHFPSMSSPYWSASAFHSKLFFVSS